MKPSSDVAFSAAVKQVQAERGSRTAYARVEAGGGFRTAITDELASFLAEIDTAYLATASADGQPYVQHRGGPRGFLQVVDDHTLGFVDLAGNRQYISTGNLGENNRVCLFLMDYAHKRRVKVWGTAEIVSLTDPRTATLALPAGRARAEQVVLITVTAWDINCPQHIPQKLDAGEVATAIAALQARIAELEAENRRLRAPAQAR
ncbi:MAG: pyridoxamine 5'-phosphate oxidase family protein [Deltaproteobacteria bacterium]|nr:pyridoxamine 5'-phosphate oxidase family protein [Deltaproteobacteria bacterium]MDQ3298777.1 pyridoxamine 5'-phosphate oxidase family protein [Myxococcota bacterium]